MNLIEFLREQEPDELIYLGAKQGSGWFYISTVKELKLSWRRLDKYLKTNAETVLWNAIKDELYIPGNINALEKSLEKAKTEMETVHNKMRRAEIRCEIVSMKKRMHALTSRFEKIPDLKRRMELFLGDWVGLNNREILEVYPHKSNPKGTCVMVNGYDGEKGDLWTIDEITDDKKLI